VRAEILTPNELRLQAVLWFTDLVRICEVSAVKRVGNFFPALLSFGVWKVLLDWDASMFRRRQPHFLIRRFTDKCTFAQSAI
jgi:hypothetical protein